MSSHCGFDAEAAYKGLSKLPGVELAVMGYDGYLVFWSGDRNLAEEILTVVYGHSLKTVSRKTIVVSLYHGLWVAGLACDRIALAAIPAGFDTLVAVLRIFHAMYAGSGIRCSRCGHDLTFERYRCPRCGREIPFTADRCPYCGEIVAVKKCPRCGARILSDGRLYVSRRFRFFK